MQRLLRKAMSSAKARRWGIFALVGLLVVGAGAALGSSFGNARNAAVSSIAADITAGGNAPVDASASAPALVPAPSPSPTPAKSPSVEIPASETVPDSFAGSQDIIVQSQPGETESLVRSLSALGIDVKQQFDTVINGAAVSVTEKQLAEIRSTIDTAAISLDPPALLMGNNTQSDAPWNLDRIDQQSFTPPGGVGSYVSPASGGAGVTVFVVDSGYTRQSNELEGRVGAGKDFAGGDHGTPADLTDDTSVRDCNGHGTHVAGTVAATTYGVAKLATIVPVRVFGCGSSASSSALIAGIEWAVTNRPLNSPSVINMSFGTVGGSTLLDRATQRAVDAGMTVVVAAGNGGADGIGDDACFGSTNSSGVFENGTSPARVTGAITVGATGYARVGDPKPLGYLQDLEAPFSNFGPCVDVLAPGTMVTSLDYASAGTKTMSGTSMASPLVAGVAALYLSVNPLASPADVQRAIVANATSGKITPANKIWPTYISGYPATRTNPSPNLLVDTQFLTASTGIPGVPTKLTSTVATATNISLAWSAPPLLTGVTIADYVVQYKTTVAANWATFAHPASAATGVTVTGLTPGTAYLFRVAARAALADSDYSAVASGATGSGVATAPVALTISNMSATTVSLTWATPSAVNGGTISDYRVQFKASSATNWTTFVHSITTATGATITGLRPNATYQFRVAAFTAQGFGADATAVSGATLTGITTPPQSLTMGTATRTTVSLNWTAPLTSNGGVVADYIVQYKLASSSTWLTFPDAVAPTTTTTVTGLAGNKSYQFRVAASTAQGLSDYSSVATKVTPAS